MSFLLMHEGQFKSQNLDYRLTKQREGSDHWSEAVYD